MNVLGFGSKLVEYRKGFDAGVYIMPSPIGLTVSAVNGQRFYTDNQWPNAVVLKIDGATFRENIKKEKSSTIDGAK